MNLYLNDGEIKCMAKALNSSKLKVERPKNKQQLRASDVKAFDDAHGLKTSVTY